MKNKVYTVTAYRWGNKENHSYVLGVFNKKQPAITAAETEEEFRGGKYECEVCEWEINKWKHEKDIMLPVHKVIRGIGK